MKSKRTDFRALRAKREAAIARPELRGGAKSAAPDAGQIEAAIAAGKLTKIPARRRR